MMEDPNSPTIAEDLMPAEVEKGVSLVESEENSEVNTLEGDPKPKHSRKMVKDGTLSVLDVPIREFQLQPSFLKEHISFNPFTSMIGIAVLWGLAIYCMITPDTALANLLKMRADVAMKFSWLIIATKPIAFFWVLFIAYRFGHVKLGAKDEKPEFSTMQFFMMVFSAGVAVGIFYYGVAEPMWHQDSHWYAKAGYHSQDEIDQMAMTYTLFHWGIAAWAVYILVAVTAGLAAYRFKLPLTFRSCFYPILGEYTWGWLGDVIDGFSIVVTVSGVCTSLGLGAITITSGFQKLGWVDPEMNEEDLVSIQTLLIWCITAIATTSVMSGLSIGIKYLSMFAFGLGMILTFIVLTLENTAFILNLQVQSIGHFLQYSMMQLNFHTDAFGQLRPGEGRAVDGNAAEAWWMDAWTIYYWNWWTAWACFVGLFVARISRGRTVGELIAYSLVAPFSYCLFWFCTWGGAGLRQARQAMELQVLGSDYFGDPQYFQHGVSEFCYDVPQEDVFVNDTLIFTNYLPGVTPVCAFESTDTASFNVLYSFSYPGSWEIGLGPTLTVLYLFAVAVYFCTSSDSGSLVVDFLASNGKHEHHWIQRLFWALTEGAVATTLLQAGGRDGLAAVQAASVIAGLPYTVFLLYLMQTMYEFCQQASNLDNEFFDLGSRKEFRMPVYGGILNSMELVASLGQVHPDRIALGMDRPTTTHFVEFLKGMLVPFVSLHEVVSAFYPHPSQKISNYLTVGVYTIMFFLWIALFAAVSSDPALRAIGWVAYFINGCLLTSLKVDFRAKNGIHGNIVGDFFSSMFLFPQVFCQLVIEIQAGEFIIGAPEEANDRINDEDGSMPEDTAPEDSQVEPLSKINTTNYEVSA